MSVETTGRTVKVEKSGKPVNSKKTAKIFLWCAIGLALAITALLSFTTIPTGQTGVVLQFGAPTGRVLDNGLHFKLPWIQTVERVNTQILMVQQDASSVSRDMQQVDAIISVNYRVRARYAVDVVRNIGAANVEREIMIPFLQESVKAVSARYPANQLINERDRVSMEMLNQLQERVEEFGIEIRGFNIVDFNFSDEFNAAIEAAQVAQQELIRVETEQQQVVIRAEAAAEAAEAEARAILVAAEAQAEANRLLAESISENLIRWETVNNWNGQLPQVASDANAIIDLR